jgi:hypothetical protein
MRPVRRPELRSSFSLAFGALLLASGCGRLGYDAKPGDDDGDAISADAGGRVVRCDEPFGAPHRVEALSAVGVDDWSPYVSDDGLSIYLASWRSGASDLFVARRARVDDAFGAPELLSDVSTAGYETGPTLAPDGTLYFVAPSAASAAIFDIYRAGRRARGYGPSARANALSSPGHDTDVELSRDGLTAYVTSDRPGGAGGRDLWRATRASLDAEFGKPVPVTELDSRADEDSLTLSADGLEVIFASNRAGGAGGLDLWHARRSDPDGRFEAPTRLAELASPADDSRPSLSSDGTTLYFNYAANVEGGSDADIWVATRCLP